MSINSEDEIVVFPYLVDYVLETQSIKHIFPFPNNRICIIFDDQNYQFFSLQPQQSLLKEGRLELTYLVSTKIGESSIAFITTEYKLFVIDMLTNEKNTNYNLNFFDAFGEDDDLYTNLLVKATFNQIKMLFEITYLEKHATLCILLKKTLKEESMNYTLYLLQPSQPLIIKNYTLKNSLFLKVFNLDNNTILLFDLIHDQQKNPQMILWRKDQKTQNFEENILKLSRWFIGTLVSIIQWSHNEIAVFANLNGVQNPYIYLINLDIGEMKLQKWNPMGDDIGNWLFYGSAFKNPKKNVLVFESLDMNQVVNVIVKNKENTYWVESELEYKWEASSDGESVIGWKKMNDRAVLVRLMTFVEKKVGVLFILEKTGIVKKYGSFIVREILDFY